MPFWGTSNEDRDASRPAAAPEEPPALHLVDGLAPPEGLDGSVRDPDGDLTATPAGERYSAWADRMRDKRRRDQARIRGTEADAAAEEVDPNQHWNADTVLGRRGEFEVGEQGASLGVLGLEPGASQDDIALAFRRLAKVHHPDRWAEADDATRRHHSEEMLRVNAAYRALRTAP